MTNEIDFREEAAHTFVKELMRMRDVMSQYAREARQNFPIGFLPEDQEWIYKRGIEIILDDDPKADPEVITSMMRELSTMINKLEAE